MARNLQASVVSDALDKADELGHICRTISEAIGKCKIDPVADPLTAARLLIGVSRDISAAGSALLSMHDLQAMRAEADRMRAAKTPTN